MTLIKTNIAPFFDLDKVHKGDLIRAKHATWKESKNGVITGATRDALTVLYYAGIGNVSNHFVITANEVDCGEWSGKCTADMEIFLDVRSGKEEEGGEAA